MSIRRKLEQAVDPIKPYDGFDGMLHDAPPSPDLTESEKMTLQTGFIPKPGVKSTLKAFRLQHRVGPDDLAEVIVVADNMFVALRKFEVAMPGKELYDVVVLNGVVIV